VVGVHVLLSSLPPVHNLPHNLLIDLVVFFDLSHKTNFFTTTTFQSRLCTYGVHLFASFKPVINLKALLI
jgi:hypothetical protein